MSDDQLADVLREIAETEARPGFKGPKICEAFDAIKWIADDFDDQEIDDNDGNMLRFPPVWIEDILIGEIIRAVKAWRSFQADLDQWMLDLEEGGDGCQWVAYIHTRDGHYVASAQGDLPWALAAAYRDAIGGGDR